MPKECFLHYGTAESLWPSLTFGTIAEHSGCSCNCTGPMGFIWCFPLGKSYLTTGAVQAEVGLDRLLSQHGPHKTVALISLASKISFLLFTLRIETHHNISQTCTFLEERTMGGLRDKKALTFLFNVRSYFLAGKSYKQFPRSGDANSIKPDKRFEVTFFRGEPLLFVCFVFTQRAFLICSLDGCFQIYLSCHLPPFLPLWFWFSQPLVNTSPVGSLL